MQYVNALEARLQARGIVSARAEAEWLVAGVLGLSRTELYLREQPLSGAEAARLEALAARRLDGEPLQYVLGWTEFCGHTIQVTPDVLIPRPETEVLVQEAIAWAGRRDKPLNILELGTGSGAIAVALGHALPACLLVAVELSWKALLVAAQNVRAHGLDSRVRLVQGSWTTAVRGRFDVIVTNPPYVATSELAARPRHERDEPLLSLDGGPDGMEPYRRLLPELPRVLEPHGAVVLECGETQTYTVAGLARGYGLKSRLYCDLATRPRGLFLENV